MLAGFFVTNVVRFRTCPRRDGLPPHQMLSLLFDDRTPVMDFLKAIYRAHRIVTVRDWDQLGGFGLFDRFKLDDASRQEFMEAVGTPQRPVRKLAGEIAVLRPSR